MPAHARVQSRGSALHAFPSSASRLTLAQAQIHFGMSGHFSVMQQDKAREERATTRLVLRNDARGLLAHLSAMTVLHGGPGKLRTRPPPHFPAPSD